MPIEKAVLDEINNYIMEFAKNNLDLRIILEEGDRWIARFNLDTTGGTISSRSVRENPCFNNPKLSDLQKLPSSPETGLPFSTIRFRTGDSGSGLANLEFKNGHFSLSFAEGHDERVSVFCDRLNHVINPNLVQYLRDLQKVQQGFERKLDTLKQRLERNGASKKDIDELHGELQAAEKELFSNIKFSSNEKAVESALQSFINNCNQHVEKADKIMGHGWLYKSVEVVVKAIVGLFAGIGMVIGAAFGQGLAKAEHRQAFKETFFSFKETQANKTLSDFKSEINELKQEVNEIPKNRPN
ncbi:hypothetical protein [Legionella pneumophila]